jgi:GNAT superfamily N-acetyltransferase
MSTAPKRPRTPFRSAPPIRIRPSRPDDLELLVRHRQGMWRDVGTYAEPDIRSAAPAYRRWLRRERREARFYGFVAETVEGTPVGSGAVWLQPVQPRPGALARAHMPYIMSMYTERPWRGRGVATRLVETMIEWSRRRRYSRITLHASVQGHPVYRRVGFEDSNEMRLNLRPVETRRSRPNGRRSRPVRPP